MSSAPSFNVANAIIENLLNDIPDNEVSGCTDPEACNYDETANVDDGSCEYASCLDTTPPDLYPIPDQTINMDEMLRIYLEAYDPDLSNPYWFGSYEITTHGGDSSNVSIVVYNGDDVAYRYISNE